jgi:hypothetical protein
VTHDALAAVVDALPLNEAIEPFQIMSKLSTAVGQHEPTDLDRAELFAFNVVGMDPRAGPSSWGGFFGPFMTIPQPDGTVHEVPALAQVTPAWIAYWTHRCQAAGHPVAASRYADLVWSLWRAAGAPRPKVDVAHRAIDCYIASVRQSLHQYLGFDENAMARSLDLARLIGDKARARSAVEAILWYQETEVDAELPGTWVVAFDLLLEDGADELTAPELTRLETDLEAHYGRCLEQMRDHGTLYPALDMGRRLAEHYRRTGRRADVVRVLGGLATEMPAAAAKPAPLVGHAWLQQVDQVLRDFGLEEERQALDRPMRDLGAATVQGLHAITAEVKLPKEKVEAYIASFLARSDEDCLRMIAGHFISTREELDRMLDRQGENAPLVSMMATTRLDARGRVVGQVGPLATDQDGNLISQAAQSLQVGGIFLREVLGRLKSEGRLTAKLLGDFAAGSAGAEPRRRGILDRGLEAFVQGDAVVALHLLVPCFEDTVRELARLVGPLSMRFKASTGGYQEAGLGEVLDQAELRVLVGDDLILHWRALFSDSRGLNLRNQIAHGLIVADDCAQPAADRVVHSLIQLGCFYIEREK